MPQPLRLRIRDFAHIADVDLTLADLTVLVGAQGTGKSLALQWLKAALDGRQIVAALHEAGERHATPEILLDLIFGRGMRSAWNPGVTRIEASAKEIEPRSLSRLGGKKERVFFIPAHRALLISDGWASPFQRLTSDHPVVARIFSQTLFERFNRREEGDLFPLQRVLKSELRRQIDSAVFHGGRVRIEVDRQGKRRLHLQHGEMQLPFMTWTAGQREFTPLLLGLYELLPPRKMTKQEHIDWVVIEEPEMGLHPQAINVVMLLVLDLLARGYRVVLSSHSPDVLTAVWALQRLKEYRAQAKLVCEAFGVSASQQLKSVAEAALERDYRVHALAFDDGSGRVSSTDISSLDPSHRDERIAGWGGLTAFSSRFGDAVRVAANEAAE